MIYPGTVVAEKYRIARLIGEGAMGSVYEAEHTSLGRRVALKILHERFASSARAVWRFEREARAAAAIGHDNIVDVIDFGHHEGVPYIVMEYLRGQTLAERIASETTIDSTEACRIAGQVLSALASAHAAGIVHRDLKPGNVMLSERSPGRVTAKILDFGISKFAATDASNRVATQAGMMLGTPTYMAPEQWLARTDVDHRADLYAVGVMLYEMLTGGLPYEGATRHELFVEVVQSTTPPPRPSEIAPEAPRALDEIALRAVHRDVMQRFQSAAAFVDALRAHGAGDIAVTPEPAKSLDGDDRVRSSSPPPKRRAMHVTQKDDDSEIIAAILRQRPDRSRTYLGVALVIAGIGISTAVLITQFRGNRVPASAAPRTAPIAIAPRVAAPPPPIAPPAAPTAIAPPPEVPVVAPQPASEPSGHGSAFRTTSPRTTGSHRVNTTQTASGSHPHANPTPMPVSDEF